MSTVKKYRLGKQLSKTSVTDSDDGNLLDIPDSPTVCRHNSGQLKTVKSSLDPSGLHLNLAEANQDIFTIPDSRSPSPIYIDTENMFNISDSPPSGLDSNLADANQDIFAISDSRSPSPIYIDRGYVHDLRFSTAPPLACSLDFI